MLADLFTAGRLDPFLGAGPQVWADVRGALLDAIGSGADARLDESLRPLAGTTELMPFDVADYVDFYASRDHASNIGRMLRPDGPPLSANWEHMPIGYHGRAGTVVVSGTPITRPNGQHRNVDGSIVVGPSTRLDIEAEVGFVVGVGSSLGTSVGVDDFRSHVFGICLVNDWSARDIQAWEYVPLGPFLGKSFATSIAAWITPLGALDAAWVRPPDAQPAGAAVPGRRGTQRRARSRTHGRGQRNSCVVAAVRFDVLDTRPDAGAHDGQRRESAHRRSVRLRNRQWSARRSVRQPDGTELERGAIRADRQGTADIPGRWRHRGDPRDGSCIQPGGSLSARSAARSSG